MPEGDTVWNTAQVLHRALAGSALTGSDLRVPRLATTDLTGFRVLESTSRGKHLLLRLAGPDDGRWTLHSHLRMDGAWRAYAPGERWTARPARRVRAWISATRPDRATGTETACSAATSAPWSGARSRASSSPIQGATCSSHACDPLIPCTGYEPTLPAIAKTGA